MHILPATYPWLCGTHDWTRLAGVFTTDADDTKIRVELPPVQLYPPPTRLSEYDPNTWRQW